jgi:tripartite-type tricarboxylate transporter receptor subunit TctC
MKKLITRLFLFPAVVLAASAHGADYPQRAIRIIVPFAAGGITDVMGRTIANHLSTELGQPVIVDNKPGASGMIGCETAAKAAPDEPRDVSADPVRPGQEL